MFVLRFFIQDGHARRFSLSGKVILVAIVVDVLLKSMLRLGDYN